MISELTIGLLVTCSSCSAGGNIDSLVSVGDRLRISANSTSEIVIVENVTEQSLIYHSEEGIASRQLLWSDVSKIEKEMPNSRVTGMGRGMRAGLGVGFVTGFIFGVIVGATDEECPKNSTEICIDIPPIEGGILAGLALGAVGLLIGGSIGAAYPGNGWVPIEPNISTSVTIDRDNTLVFEVSVPF